MFTQIIRGRHKPGDPDFYATGKYGKKKGKKPPMRILKSIDRYLVVVADNAQNAVAVSPPYQGSAFYQRVGNSIRLHSFRIWGVISWSTGAVSNVEDQVTITVYIDRQANGNPANFATMLATVDNTGTYTNNCYSHTNPDWTERITILKRETFCMSQMGNAPTGNSVTNKVASACPTMGEQAPFVFDWYLPLDGVEQKLSASTGSYPDIATNCINVSCLSAASASNQTWTVNYSYRLRYYE